MSSLRVRVAESLTCGGSFEWTPRIEPATTAWRSRILYRIYDAELISVRSTRGRRHYQMAMSDVSPCRKRDGRTNFPKMLPNHNSLTLPNRLRMYGAILFGSHQGNVSSPWFTRRPAQPKDRPMRLLYSLAAAMLVTVLLPVLHASAFTIDSTSGTTPDGSPRFVDPDEQVHSFSSGGATLNEDGWSDRNAVSRNASPAPDGNNQGITFPNWFLPTSPRR
jgi:hypothetical protein